MGGSFSLFLVLVQKVRNLAMLQRVFQVLLFRAKRKEPAPSEGVPTAVFLETLLVEAALSKTLRKASFFWFAKL